MGGGCISCDMSVMGGGASRKSLKLSLWKIIEGVFGFRLGKHQPKMARLCDWTFETKVIIVHESFLRKPVSIACLSLL